MSFKIVFYRTSGGKSPIDKFIDAQDAATQAKIIRGLELLRTYGSEVGMPYVKYLGGKLFELRIRGKNEVRILYPTYAKLPQSLNHLGKLKTVFSHSK